MILPFIIFLEYTTWWMFIHMDTDYYLNIYMCIIVVFYSFEVLDADFGQCCFYLLEKLANNGTIKQNIWDVVVSNRSLAYVQH